MMIQGAPVVLGGKKKSNVPAFAYTGKYNVRDDDVVELLESGEITFVEDGVIDVFMVGGGAGGGNFQSGDTSNAGYGGGGGGYTRTMRRLNVSANASIPVTVGSGGEWRQSGGSTVFGTNEVAGGKPPATRGFSNTLKGGSGGSGGGGGVKSNSDYGTGGSNGANGESGYPTSVPGGVGQNFNTHEFGESGGKLYAGGGGGGRYMSAQTPIVSMGGAGGGGSGGFSATSTIKQAAAAGVANTGGGGGGGSIGPDTKSSISGASGGSGIVCFRAAQELPELAGTWVLNKRVYYTETFEENLNNASVIDTSGTERKVSIFSIGTAQIRFIEGNNAYLYYNNSTNTWNSTAPTVIFKDGATASDKFRAWLASNATKQS